MRPPALDPESFLHTHERGSGIRRSRYYLGGALVVEHAPGLGRETVSAVGVVLMPPLGYEDTCAYRPLRVLADVLADAGHLVLRIDWPSLGDSAFEACQVDLVRHGTGVVTAAARLLRARGIRCVAGIGVRGGGLIALASRALDELVLWGVPASGKAFLREERAFHQTAARAYGQGPTDPLNLPEGAMEAGGFVYGPQTVASLEGLAIQSLVDGGNLSRVLLLHREGLAVPAKQRAPFEAAGIAVSVSSAHGLGALLENSYQSELRPEVAEAIRSWLSVHTEQVAPAPQAQPTSLQLEGGVTERVVVLAGEAGELSGILCEPAGEAPEQEAWTIFLNAGGVRRSGPNRLWTRAARSLAAEGRPSLRFDVRDVGDSDGTTRPHQDLEAMYSEASIQDVVQVYDWVRARGVREIDVVGLCSGAFLGVQLARRRNVRHALLFNCLAFVWNDDARASGVTSHLGPSLLDARRWRRLLTGHISAATVARAIVAKTLGTARDAFERLRHQTPADEVEALLQSVAEQGTRVHLVSSEGDPSISYLERHVPPAHRPRLTVLPAVDHTIRPVWAHERVVALIKNSPRQDQAINQMESTSELTSSA